jgi:hypothetical protein
LNARLLIEAVVRQVTVLLAELATSGGLRAPLASIADQVFIELARELDGHGISRTVSADMFGMALRTYLRRIRRYDESVTQRGTSLWEAVLTFIESSGTVTRSDVLRRFSRDEDALVRGVLQDLTDSGLVFRSGVRDAAVYQCVKSDDVRKARVSSDQDATDAMIWALVRREGPVTLSALSSRAALRIEDLEQSLARLVADGRVSMSPGEGAPAYSSRSLVLPLGGRTGWEAAVYDHFHAMVKTIVCKLRQDSEGATLRDRVGGSTYSFEVWDGHPLAERVYGQLATFRAAASALRAEVEAFNAGHGAPPRRDRVTVYMGQCVIEEDSDETQ